MRLILLFLFCFLVTNTYSQYSASFPNGAGISGPCNDLITCGGSSIFGVDWSLSGDFSGLDDMNDYALVVNGDLEFRDVANTICFVSPTIDISSAGSVSVEAMVSEVGTMEASDFLTVNYSVNGNPFTNIRTLTDDFGNAAISVSESGITGNTLVVTVCAMNAANDEKHRLESLFISGGTILPIELRYFAAKIENNHVNVTWQTSTELNNDYMEVQRSRNGKDFVTVGKVVGAGTTDEPQDYSFVDKTPLPGTSYYRLKQVDYDGAFEIHRTEIVQRKTTQWKVQTVPTRVFDQLTLYSSEALTTAGTYELLNMRGQILQRGIIGAGQTDWNINVTNLVRGSYIVKLRSANKFAVDRFVKL